MSDPRYDKISELFVNYSNGNFDYRIETSEKLDEIDAFISSINMLGEELKEITISKEFFNNVFDSVSDLIFVLDINGNIDRTNKAVSNMVKLHEEELKGIHIDILFNGHHTKSFFKEAIKKSKPNHKGVDFNYTFYYSKKNSPILCSFNGLYTDIDEHIGYILIVKDLSNLKKIENSLKASEEKYRKLFEESGDAIAVINHNGLLVEINSAAALLFGIDIKSKQKHSIFKLLNKKVDSERLSMIIDSSTGINDLTIEIKNKSTNVIYTCLISSSQLSGTKNFLIILKDISDKIEMENLVIRTIVDTQEKERKRFARDIHDSLGQQLSAVKFYLSTLSATTNLDEKNQRILEKTENGLKEILASIREICFNLMPKTIENFGLVMTVKELCNTIEMQDKIEFRVNSIESFPRMKPDKEIAIFRIIQEFINNSVKHSEADKISIEFFSDKNEINVVMKDNGIGFEKSIAQSTRGMGLKNVESRARSYNGTLKIISSLGKGTSYNLKIPII